MVWAAYNALYCFMLRKMYDEKKSEMIVKKINETSPWLSLETLDLTFTFLSHDGYQCDLDTYCNSRR